jgi:hypothetical protein
MPITSAILVPQPSDTVKKGKGTLTVKGYAVAGGGRDVVRVDVSADGGKTWRAATLIERPDAADIGYRQCWSWKHWEVLVFYHHLVACGVYFTVVHRALFTDACCAYARSVALHCCRLAQAVLDSSAVEHEGPLKGKFFQVVEERLLHAPHALQRVVVPLHRSGQSSIKAAALVFAYTSAIALPHRAG